MEQLGAILTSLYQALGLNIVDYIIILVFLFYALEGISLGFITALLDFVSFVLSFLLALKFYALIGSFLLSTFAMPQGFANALGFFIAAFLSEIMLGFFLRKIANRLSDALVNDYTVSKQSKDALEKHIPMTDVSKRVNHALGVLPGIASAFVLLSFLLTLVLTLPLSPVLKNTISTSRIGAVLVSNTQGLERSINEVFGQAINDTINFLTVKPQSDEFVKLHFQTSKVRVDEAAEEEMLAQVNKERAKHGLSALALDAALRDVARSHSKDMFERGYFSHYSPEETSPFDRMAKANISYTYAGENLALAPNTTLAMQGLMESPGHRANILSENFGSVGIGVIDGGIYGEMFVQEFTD